MITVEQRNELINKHIPLARAMARSRKSKYPTISLEELEAAAYYGLAQAASRFDPSLGVDFGAFACPRIAGSIIDYMKELMDGKGKKRIRTETLPDDVAGKEKSESFANEGFERLIAPLQEVHRVILRMHYIDQDKQEDIGIAVGLSTARVCQIIKDSNKVLLECWESRKGKLWDWLA